MLFFSEKDDILKRKRMIVLDKIRISGRIKDRTDVRAKGGQ